MNRSLIAVAVLSASLLLVTNSNAQGALEGAWTVQQEVVTGGQNAGTNMNPQPSLYLFTDSHYSMMFVLGNEPRAPAPGDDGFSDEERIAAFNSFVANSGRYETSGSSITFHRIVARVPDVMDSSVQAEFSVDGDTLVLTQSNPNTGATTTTTLTRL